MRLIGSLMERLRHRIMRYKGTVSYADAKGQTGPSNEIEWNGEMTGDNGGGRVIPRERPPTANR